MIGVYFEADNLYRGERGLNREVSALIVWDSDDWALTTTFRGLAARKDYKGKYYSSDSVDRELEL